MANVSAKKAITNTNTEQKRNVGLKALLVTMESQIAKALPSVLTPERYTRMVMTALSTNLTLQQCTPQSFLGAVMQAAQLGVEPNTPLGQAYLIPYRNKGVLEVQFQLGYQGLLDLAYRSGDVSIIDAQAVHQNDFFEYEYGLEPKLKFKPAMTDRGPVIAYYAMFKTKDGGFNFTVMSKQDIEKHRDLYSKAAEKSFSPWKTNFDSMARKTVLKQVLKYAPKKSEFARALETDNTIKTNITANMADEVDETDNTIDVTPIEPEQAQEEQAVAEEPQPLLDTDGK